MRGVVCKRGPAVSLEVTEAQTALDGAAPGHGGDVAHLSSEIVLELLASCARDRHGDEHMREDGDLCLEERAGLLVEVERNAGVVEGPSGYPTSEDGLGEGVMDVRVHTGAFCVGSLVSLGFIGVFTNFFFLRTTDSFFSTESI